MRYWSKIADMNLAHLYLAPSLGVSHRGDPIGISPRSLAQSPWAIVWRCLRDPVFSLWYSAGLWQMDRQTDRHDDSIYRASIASRGKNVDDQIKFQNQRETHLILFYWSAKYNVYRSFDLHNVQTVRLRWVCECTEIVQAALLVLEIAKIRRRTTVYEIAFTSGT